MKTAPGPIVSGMGIERLNVGADREIRRAYNGLRGERPINDTIPLDLKKYRHDDFIDGWIVSIHQGKVVPLNPSAEIPFGGIIRGVVQNGLLAYCAVLCVRGALEAVLDGPLPREIGSPIYACSKGTTQVFTASEENAILVGECLYFCDRRQVIIGFRRHDDHRPFRQF